LIALKPKTRIIVVDDHQLVLDGLASIVKEIEEIDLLATASNGKEGLKLVEVLKPDLILTDIDMPIMNGIEFTTILKRDFPEIKVIVLTMHSEPSLTKKLMELGADGYLLKNADCKELVEGVLKVASGKSYFSAAVTQSLLNDGKVVTSSFASETETVILSRLTSREIEILKAIAEGYSNKEIGDKLFISHRTVDTHRTNLMKKLEVHNIAGLIKFAIKSGLVS
jgi:DNA-binding NarL/FixJ family response regulator